MGQRLCSCRRSASEAIRAPLPLAPNSAPIIAALSNSNASAGFITPESVNYHFHRRCNYNCGFCFHVAKSTYYASLGEAEEVMRKLRDAGMVKINFSGGEPFFNADIAEHLGRMVTFAKRTLRLQSVSIVSNGSNITEEWMDRYGPDVDILAISCDSFVDATNDKIGRHDSKSDGKHSHVEQLHRIQKWCKTRGIMFKINTVLNTHNLGEDMTQHIVGLRPERWKVFQCLLIEGENTGSGAKRKEAESFVVDNDKFAKWVADHRERLAKHKMKHLLIPESNEAMRDSYLILDEKCRFLNCTKGNKEPGPDLRKEDVTVTDALLQAGHNVDEYFGRNGRYPWTKPDAPTDTESKSSAVMRAATHASSTTISSMPAPAQPSSSHGAHEVDIEDMVAPTAISATSTSVTLHKRPAKTINPTQ